MIASEENHKPDQKSARLLVEGRVKETVPGTPHGMGAAALCCRRWATRGGNSRAEHGRGAKPEV